jgi:hypothetical protein
MQSQLGLISRIIKNVGFSSLAVLISKLSQLVLVVLIARWSESFQIWELVSMWSARWRQPGRRLNGTWEILLVCE